MMAPRRPRPTRYLQCLPVLCLMLCDKPRLTTSFVVPYWTLHRTASTTGVDFAHASDRRWTPTRQPSGASIRYRGRLSAANIDAINGDDEGDIFKEEELAFAPRSERDSYVTEAQEAEQANLLASTILASGPGSSEIELQTEVSNSFLQYALSIILGRAIPDARDGLKPVHRRILYAMHQLNLAPTSSHRKSARVVGEVLGKFHPHGDMAVYDALVRLAQDFSTNYPLIDGHGNFGSIDADPAAAMRYTECRLTSITQAALMQDLNEAVVDFISNFDGNEVEPVVLPARLPILLLNGASGIAVGMATNIPPHNLREVMSACTAMVDARQSGTILSDKELFSLVPAPDFPTGASLLGTDGARQLYSTSNGGIVMRAITQIENVVVGRKGQTRTAIVVTELPYQVNKAALLEKIAGLVNDKRLDGIADLRDESDRDGIRVVIELKRDAVANVVLNNLYKKTPLQTTFSGNFLALMQSKSSDSQTQSLVPQRFTLRQALDCFLDFRFETVRYAKQGL
jgi:DNA gyrase subunit A